MLTYLLLDLLCVAVPLAYSFHPRLRFVRTWPAFWPACLVTAAAFIAWDILYTRWGVWGFNPRYLTGLSLWGLPLEEWLFFLCIPYACVFTYHCLKILVPRDLLAPYARPFSWTLALTLLAFALAAPDRLYTGAVFALTALLLLLHLFVLRADYLGRFYLSHALVLLPFLATNGLLTGSFIPDEIVWYDDAQNLGVRVFTIPIEDFAYSLLLQLTNITLYEYFLKRFSPTP